MTTILLARHGESDWNAARRWQGHADRPLSARGLQQAEALARRLDSYPLAAVYSSDLRRARSTADIVASRHRLEVRVRRDLREVDCGSWSGCVHDEIPAEQLERWRSGDKGWDGGESYEEMAARIVTALADVAASHDGHHVLVVSHGAAIRAVHAHAAGLPYHEYRMRHPSVANAALSAVLVDETSFRDLPLNGGGRP